MTFWPTDNYKQQLTAIKRVDALISLDVGKLFESVWTNVLLWQLNINGISSNLFGLHRSFLKNRTFNNGIHNHKMETFGTKIRVPQGVDFSILLIKFFILEFFSWVEAEMMRYEDNFSVLFNPGTKNDVHRRTGTAFAKFIQWFTTWRLKMDIEKTILVRIKRVDGSLSSHKIGSESVTVSDSCRLPGIEFDSKMSFKSHAKDMERRGHHRFWAMAKHVGFKWRQIPKTKIRPFLKSSWQKVYTQHQCGHKKLLMLLCLDSVSHRMNEKLRKVP